MTKSCRIGLWSVGFALLVCACSEASDSGAKGPAGSGGSGASGAPDNSAGMDTSSAGTDAGNGGADASNGGADTSNGGADTSNGGADTSAGGADTSAGGTPVVVDPNACNDIPIDAPAVAASAGVGQKPIPAGGTIVDGKYYLTAHEAYGVDPNPANYRTVIVISGAKLQLAQIKDGTESRVTFDVTTTTADKRFHAATTCPGPGQSLAYDYYTATSDSLLLFDDEKVVTLTLQP
jgi:hypothetical protein